MRARKATANDVAHYVASGHTIGRYAHSVGGYDNGPFTLDRIASGKISRDRIANLESAARDHIKRAKRIELRG